MDTIVLAIHLIAWTRFAGSRLCHISRPIAAALQDICRPRTATIRNSAGTGRSFPRPRGNRSRKSPRARGKSSGGRGRAIRSRMRARIDRRAEESFSKLGNLASMFSKLLENDFYMFCQSLKNSKSFTKLLEMLLDELLKNFIVEPCLLTLGVFWESRSWAYGQHGSQWKCTTSAECKTDISAMLMVTSISENSRNSCSPDDENVEDENVH
jgi:hypothetical protein